jgi:ABC-type transport system involved in multi-copper enzyme maturation permease subunit
MISITNIRSVARYEAKTLRRSWLFRLFAIASLLILGIMNIAVFSPVGEQDWESLAIPATIPHINLYLLNIAQALIIIFLASDFIKRDKKLDTNEVLYTRPVSNFEYIIGKTTGILRLFIGLNLIILLIALIVNLTANNTRVDIAAYLSHLLIISLPTLIYSLGLAYVIICCCLAMLP